MQTNCPTYTQKGNTIGHFGGTSMFDQCLLCSKTNNKSNC